MPTATALSTSVQTATAHGLATKSLTMIGDDEWNVEPGYPFPALQPDTLYTPIH